jgi:hypothetical protein
MRYDLVTVTMFSDPIEANLAKNHLGASEIQAFLANEEILDMAWYLGNAIGWIKLQVRGQDVDTARAVLDQDEDPQMWSDVDSAGISFEGDLPEPIPEHDHEEADELDPTPTVRERNADRAFRGAVIGLLFVPIQLYVFYLLLRIFVSNESLSCRERRKAIIAAFINFYLMLGLYLQWRDVWASF